MHPGWVYILMNYSMPDTLKVGYTEDTVGNRARSLFTTGVPEKFREVWDEYSEDCWDLERRVKERLNSCRVSARREFFRVDIPQAITVLMEEAGKPLLRSRDQEESLSDHEEELRQRRERESHCSQPDWDLIECCISSHPELAEDTPENNLVIAQYIVARKESPPEQLPEYRRIVANRYRVCKRGECPRNCPRQLEEIRRDVRELQRKAEDPMGLGRKDRLSSLR